MGRDITYFHPTRTTAARWQKASGVKALGFNQGWYFFKKPGGDFVALRAVGLNRFGMLSLFDYRLDLLAKLWPQPRKGWDHERAGWEAIFACAQKGNVSPEACGFHLLYMGTGRYRLAPIARPARRKRTV